MQLIKSIKSFFMLLLFSNTILLTPAPITISNNWIEIFPSKPLKAITGNAAIEVDITNIVKKFDYAELQRRFPKKTIFVKLIDKNGKEFVLSNLDGFSMSKNQTCIIVSGQGQTPTGVEFKKIKIKSNIKLSNVKIFWVNGSK